MTLAQQGWSSNLPGFEVVFQVLVTAAGVESPSPVVHAERDLERSVARSVQHILEPSQWTVPGR